MNARPRILVHGRIVQDGAILTGQALTVRGGVIEPIAPEATTLARARASDEGAEVIDVEGGYVIPGLIDIHAHGAHGRTFNDADPEAWLSVLDAHRAMGTTTMAATLATAAIPSMTAALATAASLLESANAESANAGLAGVHLEGPYLSPEQRGAHGKAWLREPGDGSWEELRPHLGVLRIVTLAPELAGAGVLIEALRAAGVTVSAGHSAATPESVHRAERIGLGHVAHLWSGQSALTKRGPWRCLGLLEATLASDALTAEIIADGAHVPAELARIAYRCLGKDRLCLVSDASAGTGLPAGCRFHMGSAEGVVDCGVALTTDGSAFCGSVSFLADVLRYAVREARIPLADAVHMATATPARILGLAHRRGRIAPGFDADLLVLDDALTLRAVLQRGHWVQPWRRHVPSH